MFKRLAALFGFGGATAGRLRKQVRHPEPEQRRIAAEALGGVREPWACDELLTLLKDLMPAVRIAARDALRRQGAAATGALVKALEDADPRVAVPAADLLGELRDLDAVRPLLLVMKFGSPEVRGAASRALVRYGRAAIPGLMLALRDPDPWTRSQGESVLAAIQANERANEGPAQPPSPSSGA